MSEDEYYADEMEYREERKLHIGRTLIVILGSLAVVLVVAYGLYRLIDTVFFAGRLTQGF